MMKIKAIAYYDKEIIDCVGEIKIHNIKGQNVYASWRIFSRNDNKSLAGVSRDYFMENEIFSEMYVIQKVIINIERYRILRKRVFSNVELVPEDGSVIEI